MEVLHALSNIRVPVLTEILSLITYLGSDIFFIAFAIVFLWCVDKKWGYRLFYIGIFGTLINQLLKAIFVIPRPWIRDSSFHAVESAIPAATGYSFPSGHTQSISCIALTVAVWCKKRWVSIVSIVLILLVAFSRLYLGVHTPLDVGVSLITGIITVFLFSFLFKKSEENKKLIYVLYGLIVAFAIGLVCFVEFMPKTSANVPEFDAHGLKSAYTLLGATVGITISYFIERKYINFDTKATLTMQILKCAIGLGIVIGIRALLKTPLYNLFSGHYAADAIRYLIVALFAGCIYPMTFKFFNRKSNK